MGIDIEQYAGIDHGTGAEEGVEGVEGTEEGVGGDMVCNVITQAMEWEACRAGLSWLSVSEVEM